MKALEEKILKDGEVIGTEIVKVDGFINHRIDVKFMDEMAANLQGFLKMQSPIKFLRLKRAVLR